VSTAAATADRVVRGVIAERHLRAAIVKVSQGGQNVLMAASGESVTGVPATTDMHFRNGAVAISYVSTSLLRLVDQKKVSLDDKVSRWLPEVKYSDQVTLGQLAQMTAGYVDYVTVPGFGEGLYGNPFRHHTPEELVAVATSQPLAYPRGRTGTTRIPTTWSSASPSRRSPGGRSGTSSRTPCSRRSG
jgi:CubicO group peptidase (beta-lactamase class C family)